jgi:hypothetical protein
MRHRHESLNLKYTLPISQFPIRFLADATLDTQYHRSSSRTHVVGAKVAGVRS